MKKKTLIWGLTLILLTFVFGGCVVEDEEPDIYPPNPPTGVFSVTGDGYVELYWDDNYEPDLAGYNVYWSHYENGPYYVMSTTQNTYYIDYDVINGETYYYAVAAFDYSGNESELSREDVFDTPRPAGYDVTLIGFAESVPDMSGYDFSSYIIVAGDGTIDDFYFDFDEVGGGYYLIANNFTRIQDMGYHSSLDGINWGPSDGWSTTGIVEVIDGHCYAILTGSNNYAKIQVTAHYMASGVHYLIFDWAYQTDTGNPELRR